MAYMAFAYLYKDCSKTKFSIKDFYSKCDQMCSFLQIWPHLLKKSLMENFSFCAVTERFKTGSRISAEFHGLFTKKFFFNTSFEELFARSDQQGFLESAAQMSTLNIHWMAASCGWLLLRQIIRQVIYSLKNLSFSLLHVFIFSKGANIQPTTLIKNELLRKYISSRFLTTSAEQPISKTTVRLLLSNMLF